MSTKSMSTFGHLPALLTVNEAAAQLRICRATIYNLFATGELHRVRIGSAVRVATAEVEALISRGIE